MEKELKQLTYYQALVDILTVFGESEIGSSELDTEAITCYVMSDNFFVDSVESLTKEDLYAQITDEILKGFPIWRFLKCSDWTKNMIETSFKEDLKRQDEEDKRIYKCLTCQHYEEIHTSLGVICKCHYKPDRADPFSRKRAILDNLKRSCKNYSKMDVHIKIEHVS